MERAMIKSLLSLATLAFLIFSTFSAPLLAASKSLSVAMVLWRGPTEADRGFKDRLKELGYSVTYTTMDANQSRTTLGGLLRNDLLPNLKKFDYVYSYGTTASKMTKTVLNNRTPHVFSNVSYPVGSDIVRSLAAPGENISGTTNRIPVSVVIETVSKIFKFKKVGIIFNPREKNSELMRKALYDSAKTQNFEVVDFRAPPVMDMLENVLKILKEKPDTVDVIYLPSDSFLISKAKEIGFELRTAGIRTIGTQKKYILNGALLGLVPDYYKLGTRVADTLDRHQKGEALANISIAGVQEPVLMINRTTAQALNINFPKDVIARATFVD